MDQQIKLRRAEINKRKKEALRARRSELKKIERFERLISGNLQKKK